MDYNPTKEDWDSFLEWSTQYDAQIEFVEMYLEKHAQGV
jgi:hypothetical protein